MNESIFGLVLAGGKSRRMGQDKALLRREGRSQLAHAVDLLGAVTDRVYVSARADQADEPERARYEQVVDRYRGIGPVAGILSAMDEHPGAAWLEVALISRAHFSPGRILRRNEAAVRRALDDLHSAGLLTVETRLGLDQIRFKREHTWLSAVAHHLKI